MDRQAALDYIRSAAGTQLDPTIVEAFLALPP